MSHAIIDNPASKNTLVLAAIAQPVEQDPSPTGALVRQTRLLARAALPDRAPSPFEPYKLFHGGWHRIEEAPELIDNYATHRELTNLVGEYGDPTTSLSNEQRDDLRLRIFDTTFSLAAELIQPTRVVDPLDIIILGAGRDTIARTTEQDDDPRLSIDTLLSIAIQQLSHESDSRRSLEQLSMNFALEDANRSGSSFVSTYYQTIQETLLQKSKRATAGRKKRSFEDTHPAYSEMGRLGTTEREIPIAERIDQAPDFHSALKLYASLDTPAAVDLGFLVAMHGRFDGSLTQQERNDFQLTTALSARQLIERVNEHEDIKPDINIPYLLVGAIDILADNPTTQNELINSLRTIVGRIKNQTEYLKDSKKDVESFDEALRIYNQPKNTRPLSELVRRIEHEALNNADIAAILRHKKLNAKMERHRKLQHLSNVILRPILPRQTTSNG